MVHSLCLEKLILNGVWQLSKADAYEKKTAEYIQPILDEFGFSLEDVEYVKEGPQMYLRVYIDKPGGITINDCVDVSRKMNEILDREDYIDEAYTFEVSSPDLSRPLRKSRDFDRNIGKPVTVGFYKAIDKKKEITGDLISYDDEKIMISVDDKEMEIKRQDISIIKPFVAIELD